MKPQYHYKYFVFKEYVLVRMLRILRSIGQDLEKVQDKKFFAYIA